LPIASDAQNAFPRPPFKKKMEKDPTTTALKSNEAHFKRLKKVIAEHNCMGPMLVVGINAEDSSSDREDEEKGKEKELTADQISTLRHILINKSRDKAIDAGHSFASCGQSDDDCGFMTFDTSSGNQVVFGISNEVKKALKKKTPAERFDALFGLSHGLKEFDCWMHDNECWGPGDELEKAIKTLAKAWRQTLKKSDAELKIDTEFTRPGIEALLEQIEGDLQGCEATREFKFKWRP